MSYCIREGVWKYKERVMEAEKITTQLNILEQCTASNTALLNSPTKSICECLDKTIISHPVATGTDPFSNNNSSGGNLFNTHCTTFVAQPKPALEDKIKEVKDSIALYPLQPMTEEGLAAYDNQMNMWFQRNGHTKPSKRTGFPLCLGGAQPGSNECYKCGIVGHQGTVCDSKNKILKLEGNFRALCGSIFRQCCQLLQVNYMATETIKHTWADGKTSIRTAPGKWRRVASILKGKQVAHESATIEEVPELDTNSMDIESHNVHIDVSKNENLIDLYLVRHEAVTRGMCNKGQEVPFKHMLRIKEPRGEIVRVSAVFDSAAMMAAMCQSLFEKVRHRLGMWRKSEKLL